MLASGSSIDLGWSDRPGRTLLRLAWPITISMVSYSAMTLASTAFVAHVGADELAGVGLGAVVGFGFACFGVGVLRGAKTLVSQAIGAASRTSVRPGRSDHVRSIDADMTSLEGPVLRSPKRRRAPGLETEEPAAEVFVPDQRVLRLRLLPPRAFPGTTEPAIQNRVQM